MKSFLVILQDKQTHLLTEELLSQHIDFLKSLKRAGHLILSGPFSDNQGGVLILRAESKNFAEKTLQHDPFVQAKYYQSYTIKEFEEANDDNHWLADTPQTMQNLSENHKKNFSTEFLIQKKPTAFSILFRKLKPGNTYEDFHNAWLPPVKNPNNYFNIPIAVLHASEMNDPSNIISIGLIFSDINEAMQEYEKHRESEALRHEKIEKTSDSIQDTLFCKVLDLDILGE